MLTTPPDPAVEPVPDGFDLHHEHGRSLRVRRGVEILRYVYLPWDAQLESPRPYFHPLRTLAGHQVTLYRPHDHVWHKGIAWSLPNVGTENFWGGPTFRRGQGYEQLHNNGAMVHRGFDRVDVGADEVIVEEHLDWVTQHGAVWFTERRQFTIRLLADAWMLAYRTSFTNRSGRTVPLGSPTTEGRPDAGYGGLFWRGPRSFSGGRVHVPGRSGADDLNGVRAPWLAFTGTHDVSSASSTLVFVDGRAADGQTEPTEWFVRSEVYAVVSPSPYYSSVVDLPDGQTLEYPYGVVVADGDRGPDGAAELAADAGEVLTRLTSPAAPAPEAGDGAMANGEEVSDVCS